MLHHAKHVNSVYSPAILPVRKSEINPAFDMQKDFFDALSRGDIEPAANAFALDGTLLFPGLRPVQGRPLVKRMLGIIRRRYEDIVWRPAGPAIATGEWIVTSWSVSGIFRESHLPYENEVLSLIKLDEAGQILLLSDYFKDTQAFYSNRPTSLSAAQAHA